MLYDVKNSNRKIHMKFTMKIIYPIGSMYAIYGNMDPINIPQSC